MTRVFELTVWVALCAATPAMAQTRPQTPPPPPPGVTPQPVGRDGATTRPTPAPPAATAPATVRPAPATPGSQAPAGRPAQASAATGPVLAPVVPAEPVPTEAQLGVPVYPGATFLRSFDAGQGQRYYLYGSTASFGELVLYYKNALKKGGDLVYDEPPVHMFEVGRFREETMAFPPGVTVKDYTWGGAKGYLVPTPGATQTRYPTIIQIVPVVGGR